MWGFVRMTIQFVMILLASFGVYSAEQNGSNCVEMKRSLTVRYLTEKREKNELIAKMQQMQREHDAAVSKLVAQKMTLGSKLLKAKRLVIALREENAGLKAQLEQSKANTWTISHL